MKKNLTLLLIGITALISIDWISVTTQFPEMECTDLNKKTVVLPKNIEGKPSIIVLAASKKAEEDLGTWFMPLYNTFISKKESMFATESFDVNTYFIPVFSGVNKAAAEGIRKKMLNGFNASLQNHVLIFKGSSKDIYTNLSLNNKEVNVLVLNKKGEVALKITGAYTDQKMDKIESSVAQ